jgi:hypothetical protein
LNILKKGPHKRPDAFKMQQDATLSYCKIPLIFYFGNRTNEWCIPRYFWSWTGTRRAGKFATFLSSRVIALQIAKCSEWLQAPSGMQGLKHVLSDALSLKSPIISLRLQSIAVEPFSHSLLGLRKLNWLSFEGLALVPAASIFFDLETRAEQLPSTACLQHTTIPAY